MNRNDLCRLGALGIVVADARWETRREAQCVVVEWIEGWPAERGTGSERVQHWGTRARRR